MISLGGVFGTNAVPAVKLMAISTYERINMSAPDADAKQQPAPQASAPAGPARMMSNQMGIYYSNCAMVAVSPRDISLFFGRFTPVPDNEGGQALGELYERQIYMTVEQAEDLMRMLSQTLQAFKARRQSAGPQEKQH